MARRNKYSGTELGEWLASEYRNGATTAELGRKLGVSQPSIHAALRRMGVKTRTVGEAKRMRLDSSSQKIAAEYKDGETAHALSRRYKTTVAGIRRVLLLEGVKFRSEWVDRKHQRLPAWFGSACVYLIEESDTDNVKIGMCSCDRLSRRIASIQSGNPRHLSLLFVLHGDEKYERSLHTQFADARVVREWFHDPNKRIRKFFKARADGVAGLSFQPTRDPLTSFASPRR